MAAPQEPSPPGWYPDPRLPGVERRWDGRSWTDDQRVPVAQPRRGPGVGRIAAGVALGLCLFVVGCGALVAVGTQEGGETDDRAASDLQREAQALEPQERTVRGSFSETLRAEAGDTRLRVRAYELADPVAEPYDTDPARRLVTIQIRVTNEGASTFDQALDPTLTDDRDRQRDVEFGLVDDCDEVTRVPPGETRIGCAAFQLPNERSPQAMEAGVFSRGGDSVTLRWRLP